MIFVDASAIVAMAAPEEDAEVLLARLEGQSDRVTSALALFEAVMAIRRLHRISVPEARDYVDGFLTRLGIKVAAIEESDAGAALSAFDCYGKGTGHPARLNMGDCFAYGMAERFGAALLFKGDDFARTALGPSV